MREFAALGLADKLLASGIENRESCFFNRFGQLIYKEPRGKFAGHAFAEVGLHRGRLHKALFDAARERLGPERILTDHDCVGIEQDESRVTLHFRETSTGRSLEPVRACATIACDGVNSGIRKSFYPDESLAFAGINTWRGVTRHKPILDGRTYMRIGSILTGKIVIYPIIDDIDGSGDQLINWTTEIKSDTFEKNDWNEPGNLDDFIELYESFRFDWLDVPEMIRRLRRASRISDGRQGPGRALDLRPRDVRGRRRSSDVSARLERFRASRDRCARARRLPRSRP